MSSVHLEISRAFSEGRAKARGAHTVAVIGGDTVYIHHGTVCLKRNNRTGDITLYNGGHFTPTTKTMMNACLSYLGFPCIYQKSREWFIRGEKFTEGMVIPSYWSEHSNSNIVTFTY